MDELSKAVVPFLPSLGGMNGGFSSPQTPPPHSGLLAVLGVDKDSVNDTEMNHPGAGASSNTGSGAEEIEQLVHKHKYEKVLADCHSKEEQIMNSVLMKEEFARAGRDFPQTAPLLSKEEALRRVLDDVITNENARKGMNQGANLDEIRLYTLWLSKILNRLYEEDQYYEYRSRQIKARRSDVIILGKIYETYKKWNDHFSN